MKRTLCFFLLLTAMLSLWGCQGETETSVENSYLYTQINGVLYKISPYSATITPMCPDPLCTHSDQTCPFYGIDEASIQIQGNRMYYLKDPDPRRKMDFGTKLCLFDAASASYTVVFRAEEGGLTDLLVTDQYVYFSQVSTEEESYVYRIYRLEHEGKNAVQLTQQPLKQSQFPYNAHEGRIYWWSDEAYYSTDEEYGDRRDGDRREASYNRLGALEYRYERAGFHSESYTDLQRIICVDTQTGKETVVFEALGCTPIFYGGKIVYSKLDEPVLLGYIRNEETGEKQPCYDKFGEKYYICDPDGKNERLLCDLAGTGYAIPEHPMIIGGRGIGDWLVTQVYRYTEPDAEGLIRRDANAYLLINIKTGEWKVAEFETRS